MTTVVYHQRNDLTLWPSSITPDRLTFNASLTISRPFDLLRPGIPHQITVALTAVQRDEADMNVIIQGHIQPIANGVPAIVTATIDPTNEVSIALTGVRTADIEVTITAPETLADKPLPADVVALDIWAPLDLPALRWNLGRWDRDTWTEPQFGTETLRWDEGRWSLNRWAPAIQTHGWRNLNRHLLDLATSRGMTTTGPILAATAGSLEAHLTGFDPRVAGLTHGAPIRLYHWPSRTLIWSGTLADAQIRPGKLSPAETTLIADDIVAALVNTTRYGAMPSSGQPEPWSARIQRLMRSTDVPYSILTPPAEPNCCPTVWETSLAKHIDATVATSGGHWYARRDGGLVISGSLPTAQPAIILTDDPEIPPTATAWHYSSGPAAWSMATTIAAIEATNHTAINDQEWKAADETTTVTDPTATVFGGHTVKLDLVADDIVAAEAASRRLLRRAPLVPLMDGATVHHIQPGRSRPDLAQTLAAAASLDPGQTVSTTNRGEHAVHVIAGITHTITPRQWTTSLRLTPKEPS